MSRASWFALLTFLTAPTGAAAAFLPPRAVTATIPGATFAPGSSHALDLTVRATGVVANVVWTASAAGAFALTVTPSSGSLSVPADSTARVSLTVSLPDSALGVASLTVVLDREIGGGRLAVASSAIYAAAGGRPEVWPQPSTWSAVPGTGGAVTFSVHSLQGSAETVLFTAGRMNPDPNNDGALFPAGAAPDSAVLPGQGTITVSLPTTIAQEAYGGNLNSAQLTVSSGAGNSTATGYALASRSGATPGAMFAAGLLPLDVPAAGRDGAADLSARGYWLVPSGTSGVRVLGAGSLGAIGILDGNANGIDDRILGTVRIPSFAAALSIVPGFVAASGDTLDLGLLAAGRAGLMLLDLRVVEDPLHGTWSDFFDMDGDGIDDRILRTIPLSGFATDVAWFRAPSGRTIALVADADTGSVPVAASYDRALTVPGTGTGVAAIDVDAAIDSLGGVPYAAGTLATPGSTLDLEMRGRTSPDLVIADGDGGVALYHLTAGSGAPAAVTFMPRGTVALSTAWGPPDARDIAWVPNTGDSTYLAVAAGAGGVQVVRARPGAAPELVLAQQTAAPAIGIAGAWTGTMAVALGAGGSALLRAPGAGELDKISPVAAAPYTEPVSLGRGAIWTEGRPLELAGLAVTSSATTSLRFLPGSGPIPDLLASDGARVLRIRPGAATITAVEVGGTPVPRAGLALEPNAPNPFNPSTRLSYALARSARVRLAIHDVHGREIAVVVDRWETPGRHAVVWDGRDAKGRTVGSGIYVARLSAAGETRRIKLALVR
jgi:hypothetical protein